MPVTVPGLFQGVLNFAVAWGLVLVIAALVRRTNSRLTALLFAGLILSRVMSLTFVALNSRGIVITSPWIASLISLFPFTIGPCYYWYISHAFGLGDDRGKWVHFAPLPVIYFVLAVAGYFFVPPARGRVFTGFIMAKYAAQALHILCYYAYTIVLLAREGEKEPPARIGLWLSAAYCVTFAVALPSVLLLADAPALVALYAAYSYDVAVLTAHYLLAQRYPQLMPLSRPGKAESACTLAPEQARAIDGNLTRLLEREKVYLCEDLTLNILASELGIRPYLLSVFLNRYRNKNFYSLINEHRINEAKRQLAADPDKTILAIALDSGFTSKASFNRAFMKYAAMTPSAYRSSQAGAQ